MNVAAIISEYNPFHMGHKYHIEQTRKAGANYIVAIMSGNFVQRGEPAIFSKWSRARMALLNGVDLVLEIPTIWSMSSAEKFALGAVSIADSIGCIDTLSFGSEIGDIELLKVATDAVASSEVSNLIKEKLKSGDTFAKARENAVKEIFGEEVSRVLSTANNALAIEYIKSLRRLQSDIVPFTIQRQGAFHDSYKDDKFVSASYIRKMINDGKDLKGRIPPSVAKIIDDEIKSGYAPTSIGGIEKTILYKLRCMTIEEISNLPDISEGLENRIYNSIRVSNSLEELYSNIKTKRYTHARIRRVVLSAFLGINSSIGDDGVPYIKVLGFNDRGKDLLRVARGNAKLPIIMRYADVRNTSLRAQNVYDRESLMTDLYYLATSNVGICGMEKTKNLIML